MYDCQSILKTASESKDGQLRRPVSSLESPWGHKTDPFGLENRLNGHCAWGLPGGRLLAPSPYSGLTSCLPHICHSFPQGWHSMSIYRIIHLGLGPDVHTFSAHTFPFSTFPIIPLHISSQKSPLAALWSLEGSQARWYSEATRCCESHLLVFGGMGWSEALLSKPTSNRAGEERHRAFATRKGYKNTG